MRLRLVLILSCVAALSAHASEQSGRTPQPVIEKARAGSQCIAAPDVMRRTHMTLLQHQRDDTVHGGIRGAKASLRGCIDCHAGAQTHSVVKASGDFCVSCHSYAAVKIDCFECHSGSKAAAR